MLNLKKIEETNKKEYLKPTLRIINLYTNCKRYVIKENMVKQT